MRYCNEEMRVFSGIGVKAPLAMQRTLRRWPIMLALKPWWDDPQQAAAFMMVAGCNMSGHTMTVTQRPNLHITVSPK